MSMSQDECRALFDYRDGGLYWRHDRSGNAKAGDRAGSPTVLGYRHICYDGKWPKEHRLVYLWWRGVMPKQIDHINRDRSDNRIENLRPCTTSTNTVNSKQRASKSGVRGVRATPEGRWQARIGLNGKVLCIGNFDTLEEASAARLAKARELFKEFAA